ncbi:hypothetical protein [Methylorubrum populi]|uniref:hypothetical protein n=1 Tax=Methylorubrum populi TaxID=223967 RepID=UPI001300D7AE|nr:hypothetical protein [Methylorubrum populi]
MSPLEQYNSSRVDTPCKVMQPRHTGAAYTFDWLRPIQNRLACFVRHRFAGAAVAIEKAERANPGRSRDSGACRHLARLEFGPMLYQAFDVVVSVNEVEIRGGVGAAIGQAA